MLTAEQTRQFSRATAFWNCGDADSRIATLVDPEDVIATRETLHDFRIGAASKSVEKIEHTPCGDLHIFAGCQPHGKGTPRGDLFVMDFGDARAAHFVEG